MIIYDFGENHLIRDMPYRYMQTNAESGRRGSLRLMYKADRILEINNNAPRWLKNREVSLEQEVDLIDASVMILSSVEYDFIRR